MYTRLFNYLNVHNILHCDPFSFEHNFRKYCLILIILLLLQTEINCDQMVRHLFWNSLTKNHSELPYLSRQLTDQRL